MATNTAVRRRTNPPKRSAKFAGVDLKKRVSITYVDINDIIPYEFNARNNEEAIPAVAESIKTFGFLVPCVIDKENVLVAGHTRVEAAKLLGMTEVPCVLAQDLTPAQVNAFRLADNKVSSIATWDHDLLSQEISQLADSGIDFTLLGWTNEELSCLQEMVSDACLESAQLVNNVAETHERRAPERARVVVGSIVFFLAASDYRRWEGGIRELHNYNEQDIVQDIKDRLGIIEDSVEAARRAPRSAR